MAGVTFLRHRSIFPSRVSATGRARLEIRRLLANLRAWLESNLRAWLEFAPSRNPDAFSSHYRPAG
ncbi:hypothetical protein SBA3_280006 [Candidatus Sulfopaludibacter sp. SbA3]|nr:hypothetical protein SBA3_280006 [Candidatus Sulfopaludibacter sp. SbA3]